MPNRIYGHGPLYDPIMKKEYLLHSVDRIRDAVGKIRLINTKSFDKKFRDRQLDECAPLVHFEGTSNI